MEYVLRFICSMRLRWICFDFTHALQKFQSSGFGWDCVSVFVVNGEIYNMSCGLCVSVSKYFNAWSYEVVDIWLERVHTFMPQRQCSYIEMCHRWCWCVVYIDMRSHTSHSLPVLWFSSLVTWIAEKSHFFLSIVKSFLYIECISCQLNHRLKFFFFFSCFSTQ